MDDSPTIAQALAGVRDAGSAFAFIEWFAREWLTPVRDGDGCTAEEVAAIEDLLGLRLPASLAPSTGRSGGAGTSPVTKTGSSP